MICPKCHKTMERKKAPIEEQNIYYFECPHCGFFIGKPLELIEEETPVTTEKSE